MDLKETRVGLSTRSVLIQGQPGVGKTHLAVSLGVKDVENGFSVAFYRLAELLNELRRDGELAPARMRRRKYVNVALLIVDEMGFGLMTRQDASLFFCPVSYRYGRGTCCSPRTRASRTGPSCSPATRSWRRPSSIT